MSLPAAAAARACSRRFFWSCRFWCSRACREGGRAGGDGTEIASARAGGESACLLLGVGGSGGGLDGSAASVFRELASFIGGIDSGGGGVDGGAIGAPLVGGVGKDLSDPQEVGALARPLELELTALNSL